MNLRISLLASMSCILMASSLAYAAPPTEVSAVDRATSDVLFDQGKQLFLQGKFAEACPLFEETRRLAPGIGVALHLGACYEKVNKPVEAWTAFREAADWARAAQDTERVTLALARAAVQEGQLAFLVVRVSSAQSPSIVPSKLEVFQDGKPLAVAAMGLEIPLNPGHHEFLARAVGMKEATHSVDVVAGQHANLEIQMASLPPDALKSASDPKARPSPRGGTSLRDGSGMGSGGLKASSPWVTVTWASLGVGLAGLIVGAVSGTMALSRSIDARALCEGHANNDCPEAAVRLQHRAEVPSHLATAGFLTGFTGFALGGSIWAITRTRRSAVTFEVNQTSAALRLGGNW